MAMLSTFRSIRLRSKAVVSVRLKNGRSNRSRFMVVTLFRVNLWH